MTQWQQVRSELNHDWLKNTYLRQLQAFVIRVQHTAPDVERIREFVDSDFGAWRAQRPRIADLLEGAEQALSPATLFGQPPLSECVDLDRAWLALVVHELWVVRGPIRELCDSGRRAFAEADRRFEEASGAVAVESGPDIERLRRSLGAFQAFSEAIISLIQRISAFPHGTEMV